MLECHCQRPERPTQPQVCRPAEPEVPGPHRPVAYATGTGYAGPPGLRSKGLNLFEVPTISESAQTEDRKPKTEGLKPKGAYLHFVGNVASRYLWDQARQGRHILCRGREAPDFWSVIAKGLKGRHNHKCVGPQGLRFLVLTDRWLTPPALDMSALRACNPED